MKVKVGDKIYDGKKEPIMVILSDNDKELILKMDPKATKYLQYPDTMTPDKARAFMKTEEG